jgi:uncharacterized membrane protein YbhN (UPF0104 family)
MMWSGRLSLERTGARTDHMRYVGGRVGGATALVVTVLASAFVYRNAGSLAPVRDRIGHLDHRMACVGLMCSAVAIVNRGLLNQSAHRAVGLDAGLGAMTQTSAVGFAAQKIVKPSGAAGLAVFVRHGRDRGHDAGTVTAACMLTAAASFSALGILLGCVVAVLAVTDQLSGWWIAAAAGFGATALAVVAVSALFLRSQGMATRVWSIGVSTVRRLRRRTGDGPVSPLPDDLFRGVAQARQRRRTLARVVLHAVVSKGLGALMLAAAVAASGLPVAVTDALIIYATALTASIVTIVPGGIGVVESSTAAMLIASGASAGGAALAVALFRVLDLWLPLALGALLARRGIRLASRGERALETAPVPRLGGRPPMDDDVSGRWRRRRWDVGHRFAHRVRFAPLPAPCAATPGE